MTKKKTPVNQPTQRKKLVLISKEKRAILKKDLTELFTDTNHEGYAEAVIHAVERMFLEVLFKNEEAPEKSGSAENLESQK